MIFACPGTPVTVLLMEIGDYPTMRRTLRGIRERAEAERQRPAQIGSAAEREDDRSPD